MATQDLGSLAQSWKRWLFDDALPLWASAGRQPDGGFQEAIGWDGRAAPSPLRARVQARQVYVYATAGALGWTGPWREAVQGGMDFIAAHYRRADGLYRTKVDPDGGPLDETATLYDQAFFLFAAAAAARAFPQREVAFEVAALAHLDAVERHFGHAPAGFREEDAARPFQSNPHMHLFEAAMAWQAVTGRPRWGQLADRIAELCLTRFIDGETGALREFFDAAWAPASGEAGRIVEPGHQFEWAWLLGRWSASRGDDRALAAARRLFEIGVTHGVDPRRGVALNALDDALAPLDPVARLWPQTERIKAAITLAGEDRDAQVAAACAGLQLYLDVEPRGLWRDRLNPDGSFVQEPASASSFYHIVCALDALFAAAKAA